MPEANIYQRIAEVMREVSYIQKEKKGGMPYSAVSHDAVTKKIRKHCVEHGIVITQSVTEAYQEGNRTVAKTRVRFTNVYKPEDFFELDSFGYGNDGQDKGPGKAMSYAFKYAILKAFMLETGDDPDYEQVETKAPPAKPRGHYTGTPAQKAALAEIMKNHSVEPSVQKEIHDKCLAAKVPCKDLEAAVREALGMPAQ